MPKTILTEDKDRMFPFEFYDEISERLKDHTLLNPAFLVDRPTDERRDIYQKTKTHIQENNLAEALDKQNIIEVEPLGEMLFLDLLQRKEDVEKTLKNKDARSQTPLTMLLAQLYDSSDQPVFSKDVTQDTISAIPEVLWDDPNLMLSVLELGSNTKDGGVSEPLLGILTVPKRIEEKLFEDLKKTE